ncbi:MULTISPECIES: ROK family protein [unclassified Agarivorans]|uniref:ROK family protein n=1 Tax=unclassified Agarivorans TaxID=2636026 RepID=UPI003D7C884D
MKKVTETELIRAANRRDILRTLRQHQELARVDIGSYSKLSPATITAITAELLQQGLLSEQRSELDPSASRGRPKVKLKIVSDAAFYIGLKLSINEVRLFLGDATGKIVGQTKLNPATLEFNQIQLLNWLHDVVEDFIQQQGLDRSKIRGLGIAQQGVVRSDARGILWSPAVCGEHPQLLDQLEQRLELPVFMANDAYCLAVAIKNQEQYRATDNLVAIQLGYGVGMGLIVNNPSYQPSMIASTEFGHTKFSLNGPQCRCGKRGCIEAYLGDYAIYRDACAIYKLPQDDLLHPSEQQMQHLNQLASNPNEPMTQIFNQAGMVLGLGLANIMALFNPQKIVISGPGIRAFSHMQSAMNNTLEASVLPYHHVENVVETCNWNEDLSGLGIIAIIQQHTD